MKAATLLAALACLLEVSHAFPFNFSKRNLDSLARTGQLPEYKRSLASLAKSGQLPEKLVQEKRMLDVLEQASDANSKAIQEQRNRVVEEIKNLAFTGLTKRQAASEPDFRDEFKSDLRSILDQFLEKFGTTYDPEKVELFLTNMADEVFENHGVVSLDHIRFLIETGYFQPEMREEDDVKPADGDSSPDDYIAKRFMASLARTDNMPFWYNSPRYVAKRYISSLLRQGRLPYGFQPTTESSTKKQDWTSQDGQKPKRSDATFQNSEEFIPVMQGSKSLQSIIDDLTQEPMQKRYLAGTSRILSGRLKNSGGTTSSRRQQQNRRKQTTG
ncbi:uncharacterized protein LOC132921554 isoform X2 [Rhopalosiphum padi]|uniref:uncharacterized protein LOC132921554 isoform X2 n=1 Tax=Rhopalosiphum padi TaxID=40932 RepID=UPI00298DCF85|nr:uncharacterized protein LOC132921554 isoform X2 [Rhopalosiphum padi]